MAFYRKHRSLGQEAEEYNITGISGLPQLQINRPSNPTARQDVSCGSMLLLDQPVCIGDTIQMEKQSLVRTSTDSVASGFRKFMMRGLTCWLQLLKKTLSLPFIRSIQIFRCSKAVEWIRGDSCFKSDYNLTSSWFQLHPFSSLNAHQRLGSSMYQNRVLLDLGCLQLVYVSVV